MMIDWTQFRSFVDAASSFTISSHLRPDADAIGSAIGLAEILQKLGKTVRIINPSAAPKHLEFLDPNGWVSAWGGQVKAEVFHSAEAHLIVDTSAWGQLSDVGMAIRECSQPRAVIDHHVSSDDLGALEFKDLTSPATGVLIFQLAEFLGIELSEMAATAVFAAIATDTGWFRFPAVQPETYRIAGALIELGAKPHLIYRELYERVSMARLKLASRVLGRVQLACEGKLAYTFVELHDFTELNAQSSDSEDLVNETLRLEGTQAAFIAVELLNRQIKVSLRSRNPALNVAALAEQFGGGGHKLAAGVTLPGPLPQAIEKILGVLQPEIESINGSTSVAVDG